MCDDPNYHPVHSIGCGDTSQPKSNKRAGEIMALRDDMITARDGALKQGAYGWAVNFSHVIKALGEYAHHLETEHGNVTREEGPSQHSEGSAGSPDDTLYSHDFKSA